MRKTRRSLLTAALVAALFLASQAPLAAETRPVNINTASATELADLKGIGNAKAHAIIEYRDKNGPFKTVDDLRHVKGIGDKMLDKLRPQVTIEQAAAAPAPAAVRH